VAVAEPVGDGLDPDVDEDPLGRYEVADAQRDVEAVATGRLAERLPDIGLRAEASRTSIRRMI
jgi:hypothetical protein